MKVPQIQPRVAAASGAETIRTGLLGREIMASRSPWMHQEEAKAHGLNLHYQLFDFSHSGWDDTALGAQLGAIRDEGFVGVNITHPFKQQVIPILDALSPTAVMLGAVNTVAFTEAGMIGHNTDVTGFAESVRRGLAGARLEKIVQFGAGGAGTATAHALLSLGVSDLTLIECDTDKATALVDRLAQAYPDMVVSCCHPDDADLRDCDGIVNATPIGMAAHPGMPFKPGALDASQWVADIVYFPLETALLRAARARGCRTLNGKGMAVFQAADAFAIFTGLQPDRDRMLSCFDAFKAKQAA
jgi:shikimate dehydrogenase